MIRRARSAITGRFVRLATATMHPRETVLETRRRVDDRRVAITIRPIGEIRPGDTLVAELPGASLHAIAGVRRDLERWVDDYAPGAQVLAVSDDVELSVDRRLADVDALVTDLERRVEEEWERIPTGAAHTEGARAREHITRLEEGITAIRLTLDGELEKLPVD